MKTVAYVNPIRDDARYRVEFDVDKGSVSRFVVQLEIKIGDDWRPVVRYDNAHGFAHRDRYDAEGKVSKHEPIPRSNFNDALTFAILDIRRNWDKWIREFRK